MGTWQFTPPSEYGPTGDIVEWVVPDTGSYRIEAAGAAAVPSIVEGMFGRGAKIAGTFNLTAGTVVSILLGRRGQPGGNARGGAGGTFVYLNATDETPLIAAGGGGGTRGGSFSSEADGQAGPAGGNGSPEREHVEDPEARGGTAGRGAAGWGGAGWLTDALGATGGKAPRNGGTGGQPPSSSSINAGGFGGGGAGRVSSDGDISGGGGGYSGGGRGATGPYFATGGGGGSYNGGTDQQNTAGAHTGAGYVTITGPINYPPHAPTLTFPADGEVINQNVPNRFTWLFNDPNIGDAQSAFRLRYRAEQTSAWTELDWRPSPASLFDVPGGTFSPGDWEWQAAVKDSQGVAGPWSQTGYFTAGSPPEDLTILAPANNGTIDLDRYPVRWSTPNQDAYQVQVLTPGGAVHADSGVVESTAVRVHLVEFPDNQTNRTVRVRVRAGGLWSEWAAVTATVSYQPPATPDVTVIMDGPTLRIVPTFPPPTASGEPAVESWDLWVRGGPEGEIRLAAGLPPGRPWQWWLPASGVDYAFRVVATGTNSVTARSPWVGAAVPTLPYSYGGAYS